MTVLAQSAATHHDVIGAVEYENIHINLKEVTYSASLRILKFEYIFYCLLSNTDSGP